MEDSLAVVGRFALLVVGCCGVDGWAVANGELCIFVITCKQKGRLRTERHKYKKHVQNPNYLMIIAERRLTFY